jgi:hypothetical protein
MRETARLWQLLLVADNPPYGADGNGIPFIRQMGR